MAKKAVLYAPPAELDEAPKALEAEIAVLGSMMLDDSALRKASTILRAEDFFRPSNQIIYSTILEMHDRGWPVDLKTLSQYLKDREQLEQAGSLPYLADLLHQTPTPANVEYYARAVLDKSAKRRLMVLGSQLYHDGQNGKSPDSIIITAETTLSRIGQRLQRDEVDSFDAGLMSAADIPAGGPVARLWFGLYPGCLVFLTGDTGAGKSTLLYTVSIMAARNESLWDVPFGHNKPLRVLYIDPENSGNWQAGRGGNCANKLDRIALGRPKDLVFHTGRTGEGQPLDLRSLQARSWLTRTLLDGAFDICILDPIANLFGTEDENDNAEANHQMKLLAAIAKETNCCIICCHHNGRDGSGPYGRGATGRLCAADVGFNFRCRGDAEEIDDDYRADRDDLQRKDICRLQIVKNRMEPVRASLFLRMVGDDRFDRVGFPEWKNAPRPGGERVRKETQAEEEIPLYLSDSVVRSYPDIVSAMRHEGIGEKSVRDALRSLVASGALTLITGANNAKFYRMARFGSSAVSLGDCRTAEPDLCSEAGGGE